MVNKHITVVVTGRHGYTYLRMASVVSEQPLLAFGRLRVVTQQLDDDAQRAYQDGDHRNSQRADEDGGHRHGYRDE